MGQIPRFQKAVMRHLRFAFIYTLLVSLPFLAQDLRAEGAPPANVPAKPPLSAKIFSIDGKVQIKTPKDKDWREGKKGDLLPQGSMIMTGAQSECEIALGSHRRSAVKVHANSRANLKSLEPNVDVHLESGKIFSLVRDLKPGSKFEVSTPTAISAARGTGWEQDMDSVRVFESTVEVTGATGEQVMIPEGQGVEIADNGDVGETYQLPDEAKAEFNEFKQEAEVHVEAEAKADAAAGEVMSEPADAPKETPDAAGTDTATGVSPEGDHHGPKGESKGLEADQHGPEGEYKGSEKDHHGPEGESKSLEGEQHGPEGEYKDSEKDQQGPEGEYKDSDDN